MRLLGIAAFSLAFALPATAQVERASEHESFYQFDDSICRDEVFRHERTAWPLEYVYPRASASSSRSAFGSERLCGEEA